MAKRGESIVEVVVACGILSMIFVSVASMIVASVRLNEDARFRMEAVFLAQKELNKYIVNGAEDIVIDSGSCKLVSGPSGFIFPAVTEKIYYSDASYKSGDTACDVLTDDKELIKFFGVIGKDKCQFIEVRNLEGEDETADGLVNSTQFLVVESHVKWVSRALGYQEYIIRKLVRR